MKAIISWWDLAGSEQTIDTLRVYLREEGVAPWERVQGLRLKFWISDRQTNRWGAVMLLQATPDPATPMPLNRATELIGYPPTERLSADIEAIVAGIHSGSLTEPGLAFDAAEVPT